MKERHAIYFETEGKNKGCWVMPDASFSTDAESEDNKVIVRSNGTVTYFGKDIAYQLWKFALLGKDFFYPPLLRYADGRQLWVQTHHSVESPIRFAHRRTGSNPIHRRHSY